MCSRPFHIWTRRHQQRLNAIVREGRLTVTITEAVEIVRFPQFPLLMRLKALNIKTRGNRGKPPYKNPAEPHMLTTHARDGRLTVPLTDIAREFAASYQSLLALRSKLGLRGKWDRFVWTPEHMAILASLMDAEGNLSVSTRTAARRIGCTSKALSQKLWKMKR